MDAYSKSEECAAIEAGLLVGKARDTSKAAVARRRVAPELKSDAWKLGASVPPLSRSRAASTCDDLLDRVQLWRAARLIWPTLL